MNKPLVCVYVEREREREREREISENLLSVETRKLYELSVSPDLILFTFTPWEVQNKHEKNRMDTNLRIFIMLLVGKID